jgi:hypothetical protein
MAAIKTVSGVGARGSAGVEGNDQQGAIIIHANAYPWQEQPSLQGSVAVEFLGDGPSSVVAESGWAKLEAHLGQQTVINWTCNRPLQPGDTVRIFYR